MRKLILFMGVTIFTLVIMSVVTISVAMAAGGSFGGGIGTPGDPYQIEDCLDLQAMKNDLAAHYKIMNFIDCAESVNYNNLCAPGSCCIGFEPVGPNDTTPFTGSLDGQGFIISQLTCNYPAACWRGLFGCTGSSAVLQNISLELADITGYCRSGALAGENQGSIDTCYATCTLSGTNFYTGGLVGYNNGGVIINSHADGNVSGNIDVGVLAGYSSGTISNSYATGGATGIWRVGGLVGDNENGFITDCYATSTVNGGIDGGGGLVGCNLNGSIIDCYATGYVSGIAQEGGLAGRNSGTGLIERCYATGNVDGNDAGGLVGYNNASIINCYATGEATSTSYGGGLIGFHNAGLLRSCYSSGTIFATSAAGGLMGVGNSVVPVENCYATGQTTGLGDVGGLTGHNSAGSYSNCYWANNQMNSCGAGLSIANCAVNTKEADHTAFFDSTHPVYNGATSWDFTPVIGVWGIQEGASYPYLGNPGIQPPVPELSVIILVTIGLLGIAGFLCYRRQKATIVIA